MALTGGGLAGATEAGARTAKPIALSMAATAVLPLAMPPVRPRRCILLITRAGGGLHGVGFDFAAAELRGFYGVAHEHGDGHGTDAAGNGRARAGRVRGVRVHVTYER